MHFLCKIMLFIFIFIFIFIFVEAPPTPPKPIALVSPEKLPFRERVALYQTKLNQEEMLRKSDNRRSWAPGIHSPRSLSLSPVHSKWSSASYILRNSPSDTSKGGGLNPVSYMLYMYMYMYMMVYIR